MGTVVVPKLFPYVRNLLCNFPVEIHAFVQTLAIIQHLVLQPVIYTYDDVHHFVVTFENVFHLSTYVQIVIFFHFSFIVGQLADGIQKVATRSIERGFMIVKFLLNRVVVFKSNLVKIMSRTSQARGRLLIRDGVK